MLNDAGDIWTMVALTTFALAALLAAYAGPEKWTTSALIFLTPFQPVMTKFATVNVLIAYVIFVAYLIRDRIKYIPGIAFVVFIVLALLASLSQAHPATFRLHIIYIFSIGSAFCVYFVTYNTIRRVQDSRYFVNLFVTLNWVVVAYCALQLMQASGWLPFDLGALHIELEGTRGGEDPRLKGPFGAIGLTAEYLVLSTMLLAYISLFAETTGQKVSLGTLGTLNLLFLIATGNRGGFLVFILGVLLFLYVFHSKLGAKKTVNIIVVGSFALAIASFVTINYTKYDRMYDRLESTEFEGAMPDTRARTWRTSIAEISQKPFLGHGAAAAIGDRRSFSLSWSFADNLSSQPLFVPALHGGNIGDYGLSDVFRIDRSALLAKMRS